MRKLNDTEEVVIGIVLTIAATLVLGSMGFVLALIGWIVYVVVRAKRRKAQRLEHPMIGADGRPIAGETESAKEWARKRKVS